MKILGMSIELVIVISIIVVAAIIIFTPKKYWLPLIIVSPFPPIP